MTVGNKESLQKLDQTSSNQAKLIFKLYQTLLNLRNRFLFCSTLELYDFMLLRNQDILTNKECNVREFLAGKFRIMEVTLENIRSTYKVYTQDAVWRGYSKVELADVVKRSGMRDEPAQIIGALSSGIPGMVGFMMPKLKSRAHHMRKPIAAVSNDKDKYNYKVLKLNTMVDPLLPRHANNKIPTNPIRFSNMLEGFEAITKEYKRIQPWPILLLSLQVLFSNWHYICYMIMIIFTFLNGGLLGFTYSGTLIIYVLVEEYMPGLFFWKISYLATAAGLFLKLIITGGATIATDLKMMTNTSKTFITNHTNMFLGSSSYVFEIFIMIFILIQLIIIDELGFKGKKMIDYEDTNTAYIRMKVNKIFSKRDEEQFKIDKLYYKALYESITEAEQAVEKMRNVINYDNRKAMSNSGKSKSSSKRSGEDIPKLRETEPTDINLPEVLSYIEEENQKKLSAFKETIDKIEKNIFIKHFGKFSESDTKSFLWQLFTVYVDLFNAEPQARHRHESAAQLPAHVHAVLHRLVHRQNVRRHPVLHRPSRHRFYC